MVHTVKLDNNDRAMLPVSELGFDAAGHATVFDRKGNIVFVWNEATRVKNGSFKPEGFGLPGGGILINESPIQGTRREFYQETGARIPQESFTIFPKPFFVSLPRGKDGRYDFFFAGEISPDIDLPYREEIKIQDPDKNVLSLILINPYKDIEQAFEGEKKKFVLKDTDKLIYGRHVRGIRMVLGTNFDLLKNGH